MKIIPLLVGLALSALAVASNAQQDRGATSTNHDFFDLQCAPDQTGVPSLLLHVEVASDGQFDVTTTESGIPIAHDTRTYTNAVTWLEGKDRYVLNRSSGEIKVRPGELSFKCEKIGGRKF